MRPTMMDVAAKAGVSQATVSLVLNSRAGARLSEATREKVRAAADELGYQLAARGQTKVPTISKTIGFVVDELTADPWMSLAFDSAREKALEQGITTTLAVLRGGEDLEDQILTQMSNQPLLGFIYGTILTRPITPPKAFFKTPTVLVNCYDKKRKLPSVLPGELVGAQTATQHLIDMGCRRIAFINGQEGIDASRGLTFTDSSLVVQAAVQGL